MVGIIFAFWQLVVLYPPIILNLLFLWNTDTGVKYRHGHGFGQQIEKNKARGHDNNLILYI